MGPGAGRPDEDPLQLRPEDQLDRDAIKRLVGSLSRLLDPADALAADRAGLGADVHASRARSAARYVLDGLWRRLGIDTVMSGLDTGPARPRRGDPASR